MAYGSGRQQSVLEAFSLSPLPYPVLLIIITVLLLLSVSWTFSYEEMIATAEERLSFGLLLAPLALLLLIRLLPSTDSLLHVLPGFIPSYDRRNFYDSVWPQDGGGASPWGVAALVVLLIVLASFHSSVLDMWGP